MNCIYCNNILSEGDCKGFIARCSLCDVYYGSCQRELRSKEYYVTIYDKGGFVPINGVKYKCFISKRDEYDVVIKLDYIPNITPYNLEEKIKTYITFY